MKRVAKKDSADLVFTSQTNRINRGLPIRPNWHARAKAAIPLSVGGRAISRPMPRELAVMSAVVSHAIKHDTASSFQFKRLCRPDIPQKPAGCEVKPLIRLVDFVWGSGMAIS
jgi:hypothetical protein